MLGKKITLAFLVIHSCIFLSAQQRYAPDVLQKIKQIEADVPAWAVIEGAEKKSLSDWMQHYHVPALSIAVIHNYKVEWAKAYGWANPEKKIPATTQTLFQAASISKSLNAVGVLKLVQQGKLNLNEDINHYLKEWKLPASPFTDENKPTIYNLLTHTAGLNVHGFPGYNLRDTLPTIIQILKGEKPSNTEAVKSIAKPGETVRYSGGGTLISQLIVSEIIHQPYDEYQWKNVLKPLGMNTSFFTSIPPKNKMNFIATAHDLKGQQIDGEFHIYPEEAPAALWTNPSELAKFIIELQLAYEGRSSKLLTQSIVKQMMTPFKESPAGLGVFINKLGDRTYFQHGGSNEGFKSQYYGSLSGGDGVVIMINSDQSQIIQNLMMAVTKAYNWKGFPQPVKMNVISIPDSLQSNYPGNYLMGPVKVIVSKKDGKLFATQDDGPPMQLHFTSPTDFFLLEMQAPIKFEKNTATGLFDILLKQGGNELKLQRKQ